RAALSRRSDSARLVAVPLARGPAGPARVLDLGTGTGAIALALAAERPRWQLIGVDRMPAAVALARRNGERLGLTHAYFLQSDWFSALDGQCFDMIVSNPPYIAADDPHLALGDVRFEPASALVSGEDGLDDIRRIIAEAPDHLAPGGWLLLEHGWQQAPAVCQLLRERGMDLVQSWRDLGGQLRVSGGQWHASRSAFALQPADSAGADRRGGSAAPARQPRADRRHGWSGQSGST